VAANEADRLKLVEIERRLEQDPTIARAFRGRRRCPRSWPCRPSWFAPS